ncbi:hypothetical protein [Deinococcus alpinitundrae]|uniref:hypothetical protein n=1 Tax=Deinococcus alpinitundrae TaxID=468913 RepID=UPI00137B7112|nr:hypothetical protein [Deinococcus alpinitundrae]
MRSIKVAFIALALSAATTAFAANPTSGHTVQIDNGILDTIAVVGSAGVEITALHLAATDSTSATLAYSTNADHGTNLRKVTVSSTPLPDGVTGTVEFTPTAVTDDPNGLSQGPVALGSSVKLVGAITPFITQAPAALSYSFTATKGFEAAPITVTYTIADE